MLLGDLLATGIECAICLWLGEFMFADLFEHLVIGFKLFRSTINPSVLILKGLETLTFSSVVFTEKHEWPLRGM